MYFYYINNRKETFENLDTFIKTTNNGQWNFSSYNPYANLKDYTDSFILLYSDNENVAMGYKELLKYNKEKLNKFFNDPELNNQIKVLLNRYNKTDNKVLITNTEFRKMGLEYVYTVPLMTAYDKLNYIKNKTRLKTSINNFLIKDLRKYVINKYIEKKSITNQIDTDDSIIVELKYTLLDNKTITNIDSTYTTKILKKIKKYLKFDIINNGTSISDNIADIHIKFKIINYDNSENIVSIINTKIERLYDILFTEILNTNNEENILHFINLSPPEDDLKNISLYGSDLLKDISLDISPNCSVPSGDKIILNTYKFDFNKSRGSYGFAGNDLKEHKEFLLSGIVTGNNSNYYNCNIYDISYNLNNDSKFKLNIYDNVNHFDNPSSLNYIKDKKIPDNKYGVMYNNARTNDFNTYFNINIQSSQTPCITNSLDVSSTQIKTQLYNLSNIKGLDKRAKDNVKAILFANLNLESFKNHLNQNLKEKDYLIKLRIIGKAFNFLEGLKNIEKLDNSIVKQLKLNKENNIDITDDKLIAAVYYIIEKHIRENNNEFKLKEKLLFDNQTLRNRSDIIESYIPETTNSELEKLFFMTTREKIDYFDNNTNVRNTIELELKLIEKMKTSELETYFKEVNLLKKDVNDRLKIIISSNSNNILRIHKKLNNIAGGKFNKFKGGNVCNTINSNNQEIGTLSKDTGNFKITTSLTYTNGESFIAIYDQDIIIDTTTNDKIPAYHHLKLIKKEDNIVDIFKYNYETKAFSSEKLSTDISINSGGKLYKAHNLDNDNLLLHSYNNMTIKDVTSNINSMAYYKNKIYVVGNSGYFSVSDLSDKVFNTVILKDKDNNITQNYENLNHICIDNDICLIVGDNGVYINGNLSDTPNTFKIFYCGEKKDFNECLIITNSDSKVKKYAIANNNELFKIPETDCDFHKLTIGGGENNNELIPIKLIDKNDISNITKGTVLNISIEKNSKLFKKGGHIIKIFPKGAKYIVEEFDPSSSELNIKMRLFWEGIDFGNDYYTFLNRMDLKDAPNNIEIGHIFNRNNELIVKTNYSSLVVDIEKKKYTTSEILKIRNYYNGNIRTDINKSNNNISQGTVLYIESDEENQNLKSNRIKYIIDKIDLSNNSRDANTKGRLFYEKSKVGDKELFRYTNSKDMFILTYKDDIFLATEPERTPRGATIYKNLTPEEYNKYNEKYLYNDVNSVKETIKKGTVLNATLGNNPQFPDEVRQNVKHGFKFIVESTTPNLVVRIFWEDTDTGNESDNKQMIEYWTHPDRINSPRLSTATIDIENNKIKLNIAHEYFFVNIKETLTDDEIQTKRTKRIASISDNKQKGGTSIDYKLKNLIKLNDNVVFLKMNNTNTELCYLNTTNDNASISEINRDCNNMFICNDVGDGLYLIYIINKVIYFDSISINQSDELINSCVRTNPYKTRLYLDTNERITSLTVNVDTISMITNKLNYYKLNNPYNNSDSYLHTFNMKIASDNNNIEKPKLFSIPSQSTDYINLFNYGTAGQIINYNINNINQEDIKITNNSPIFSGYDNNNNAVFTFNTNHKYSRMFNLTYTSGTTDIRLYGNQNSYLYQNNKRIIRYNNYTPDITNYDIKVFSIRNNNYVNIPLSDTNNYNLLSNNVNIKINKFTEINKNEFVSLALFINDKFKIWLKPGLDNNFNSYTHILDFKNNTLYKIKLYINGREQPTTYILNKPIDNSINISAIIYNGMNIYNNNTISLTDVSVNKLNLFIVSESESASVLYEKSYVSNKLISNIDKNQRMISIGIKNGTEFKLHNIKIVSSNKIYTNLTDYELNYLLEIDVNKAYNYLKKTNKLDLTIRYLLQKYRVGEEEDVQIYLSLIKSKSDRDNLQNTLINSFTDEERTYYIKNYLNSNKKYNIPKNEDSSTSDKIVNKKTSEQNKLLESLKVKLDKLKIEKEILSNQYKIEQRNRMFEKMDVDKLVKKEDINKLEEEIIDVDKVIKESEKNNKSKSFFSKLLSFFSTEEKGDLSLVERLVEEDKEKIVEKKLELKQQLEEMNNEDKLKEIEDEYNINLEKLRLENKVKLERERNNLDEKIKNGEIIAINGDLEIKKDIIESEKINLEMDKLFSVQKNLIKKQKSLLKIIKPKEKILPKINNNKLNTLFTKIDTTMTESNNNFQQLNNSNLLQTNQQTTEATNIVNTPLSNIETTKNIIKDFKEEKIERNAQKNTKIKTDILNDIDSEIKKEKLIKKGKKPCVSFIDCYFKGLDNSFYTSYKKENTFIKDSSLPKTKKPTCKPKKDCNVCYLETKGVPNSIIYNNNYSNNSLNLNIKGNINSHFMNDYTDLPDCPFDTCMSCENINNYSLFNNNTFNDKLIQKYTKN